MPTAVQNARQPVLLATSRWLFGWAQKVFVMDVPAEPAQLFAPHTPRGCGCRSVILLGLLGGMLFLVCGGACGFLVYLFTPSVSTSADEIVLIQQEIAPLAVPAFLEPVLAQKLDNPLVTLRQCVYRHQEGRGVLRLMETKVKFGEDEAGARQMLDQLSQDKTGGEIHRLEVSRSETREFIIQQESVPFRFDEGRDLSSATRYRQVSGDFRGKNGWARLILQLEEEVWDEDAVTALLNSLK